MYYEPQNLPNLARREFLWCQQHLWANCKNQKYSPLCKLPFFLPSKVPIFALLQFHSFLPFPLPPFNFLSWRCPSSEPYLPLLFTFPLPATTPNIFRLLKRIIPGCGIPPCFENGNTRRCYVGINPSPQAATQKNPQPFPPPFLFITFCQQRDFGSAYVDRWKLTEAEGKRIETESLIQFGRRCQRRPEKKRGAKRELGHQLSPLAHSALAWVGRERKK